MDRLVLLVACVAQIGCQSPTGYSLFGTRQTRVPPPPTGVIGGDDYYSSPAPTDGSYVPPQRVPGEQITGVGPWRYWESANKENRARPASNLEPPQSSTSRQTESVAARSSNQAVGSGVLVSRRTSDSPLSRVKKNDRLPWKEPTLGPVYSGSSYSEFAQQQLPVGIPTAVETSTPMGSDYPPRLLPQTGPVLPLAAKPVRIRSFPNSYSRQPVGIPVELAEYQDTTVRQASASSPDWQRRYDDVRR